MNKLDEIFKIADIHASRIEFALNELKPIFPIDEHKVENLSTEELLLTDMLVLRFAKLQDFIGRKLIDTLFAETREIIDELTMIDKLHKLERLGIIDSVATWDKMRDVRNYLTHEYPENPENPEKTADNLNSLVTLAPKLLKILQNIKDKSK